MGRTKPGQLRDRATAAVHRSDHDPPQPKRTDSAEIVEAVIVATCALGDPDASVNQIAELAGVGIASLYRYFPTRAAIYAEISRRLHRQFLTELRELFGRDDLSIRGGVEACCRLAIVGPEVSREMRHALNVVVPFSWSKESADAVFPTAIQEMSAWLKQRLDPVPADLDERMFVAFSAVRGIVSMAMVSPDHAPALDTLVEAATRGCWAILFA